MNSYRIWRLVLLIAAILLGAVSRAEDIDIFTGTTDANVDLPNVIFVLDNTSNWSRQAQKWPGGLAQGQSEARAIKNALADKIGKVNVGIVEYVTGGGGGDDGYVRHNLSELTDANYTAISAKLDEIYNNINSTNEKRNSDQAYADLPWDVYNYLNGDNQSAGGGLTPTGTAPAAGGDADAYTTKWSKFKSPLGDVLACAGTYIIFVGNNNNGAVKGDSTANTNALDAAYVAAGVTTGAPNKLAGESTGTPLPMPGFACTTATGPDIVVTAAWDEPIVHQGVTGKTLGTSAACWKSTEQAQCTTAEKGAGGLCVSVAGITNCSCTTTNNQNGCNGPRFHWNVVGDMPAYTEIIHHPAVTAPGETTTQCSATGQQDTTGGLAYNFDDWAKFLYTKGVPMTATVNGQTYNERAKVVTYTIDVFNAQQSATLSGIWFSAANAGGGKYFQAKNEDQIMAAIGSAFDDILSVSSSFTAVSLPLSETNRARVDNQVYIGMFRPAAQKKPRWFGNMKRYQLAQFNGVPELVDINLHSAISHQTGFAKNCAASFWTEDSSTYWQTLGVLDNPDFDAQFCSDATKWTDLPDGPFVEKGGVAQQTRAVGTAAATAAAARTLYTVQSDTALRALATTGGDSAGAYSLSATALDYLRGSAAGLDEIMPASGQGLRPSIHGDVVHSRPLSIRYSAGEIRLYYGTNDGIYRSVDPADGTEKWGLVAPEHFSKVQRLQSDSPLIKYTSTAQPGEQLKDYFFDGSTGQITEYAGDGTVSLAYIYPTQRRGGRMVYALDVSDPNAAPDLLWRVGCPNLGDDTGCTSGFSGIGQTWSMPIGGKVQGYVDGSGNPKNIVIFGGGFDDCLNADAATYPSACSSAKGKGVYILDAATGTLLKHLDTDAPVISEVSPVDINFDGLIDFAYAADVKGNLYRVNFGTMASSNPAAGLAALDVNAWTMDKVASMSDDTRRFYNAPVVGAFQGMVVVTIGSGDRERPLDSNYPYVSNVQNRFYAFFDEPYKTFVANPSGDLQPTQATTVDLDGDTMLAVVATPADFTQEYDGWYMDLPDRGEQVANPAAIGGGKVFFNTFQPGGTNEGLCTRPLGIGTGYAVDLFGPEYTQGTVIDGPGIPIPPVIATVLMPPGEPDCPVGQVCPPPDDDPCASGGCEYKTVCIGCQGFTPVEIVPNPPPLRRRIFFTEDVDRTN
jgi:type IV pilus assembly protein PilY1